MPADTGRLLIVSNRLPLTIKRSGRVFSAEPSAGGLVTAMRPVLEATRGVWFGWPGEEGEEKKAARFLEGWLDSHRCSAVRLPRPVASRFYHGFANGTLWPLFHQFPSRLALAICGVRFSWSTMKSAMAPP